MNEIKWQQSTRIKQFQLILVECFEVIGAMESLVDRKFEDVKPETFELIKENVARLKGIMMSGNRI